MILSSIGRYAILLQVAVAVSFRGSAPDSVNHELRPRILQVCSTFTKKSTCPATCVWVNGKCVPAATPAPTPAPTRLPTPAPTPAPTPLPTPAPVPPTVQPTAKPTVNPTAKPTVSPTAEPTFTPTAQPTPPPTTFPTDAPTPSPTKAPFPTNAPTPLPTKAPASFENVACPPVGSGMVSMTSGLKLVTAAPLDTFCGMFVRKSSGDLVPLARSYHGQDWEPAPGPLACPPGDVTASSVSLPPLANAGDEYVILSKDGSASKRKQIARFLEMTTFGPKLAEVDAPYDGGVHGPWGATARASYVRSQVDEPATSHREYWRKRANAKWDATAVDARSDHPCSPGSKWRTYAYTRQDQRDTITSDYIYHTWETVPEEANLTYAIYEADSAGHLSGRGGGAFRTSTSTSGGGYYDFSGTGDYLQWSVSIAKAGQYPVSFRYAMGSTSYNGNRPLQLWVNAVLIQAVYDFPWTDSWSYWMYSELVTVNLNAGVNTIKIIAVDQPAGPDLDHLRIGKPPALVMKSYGWPRLIARNGLNFLEEWVPNANYFPSKAMRFINWPDPVQGDLWRYPFGRIRVRVNEATFVDRYLDIGNPRVDFTGYEQYLPPNVFQFTEADTFVNTASQLHYYPMVDGQEFLLINGFSGAVCDSVPPFAEEQDAPIFGKLPDGTWLQWTPTVLLENNGPTINESGDRTAKVLSDGGGQAVLQTGEKLKCSNVQRSFVNEDTCFLSLDSTACSATQPVGEVIVPINTTNVISFYDIANKYVYAIRGLAMESVSEHACRKAKSRWEVTANAMCPNPTPLAQGTATALGDAFTKSSDKNTFVRDVTRTLACNPVDETVAKLNIQIQVGNDCYTHVHPDHLNVYDFSGWVTKHPGGEYNIQKWAQNWNGVPGWYLDFPFLGDAARGIPEHPMSRWYNRAVPPDVVYVARLGDSIAFRDLPNDLKTDGVAAHFGAVPTSVSEGGIVVCGSIGEVANDPSLAETFDLRSNVQSAHETDEFNNQKAVVWTEVALAGKDQLRQRMAWALSQIVTTVPANIDGYDRTEMFLFYYDIFVRHAFGNYRDILGETSYSPLMAEHLSYLRSKSHSYVYEEENKRISRADENYAREVMQLFSIGLVVLNDDGTPVIDPVTGSPLETYTNEDIESFARAWTGFDRTAVRGNYEEVATGTTDNRMDPMLIQPDWRDPFPKPNLNGGFIGDGYVLCKDLPARSFLKKGAGYRLLGGKSSPELMKDPSYFSNASGNDILRVTLNPASSGLYARLYNGGNLEMFVTLENDIPCAVGTVECEVDTVRVVKVGSVYYEFVERPCVQMAFYDNGKQVQARDNWRYGQMCANPDLAHAREACCREDRVVEVRTAMMKSAVTYRYDGERMTYDTAQGRCAAYGKDLCLYEGLSISPNDDYRRKGYHWTNKDCGINVKVNSEGYIAIVHDATSTYINTIPWLVEKENTLNWFRVFWNGGSYPGDDPVTNSCAMNGCETMTDGSCYCKTTVADTVVFTGTTVTKQEVMGQLFIGAEGPQVGSAPNDLENGVIAHVTGSSFGADTVFEVQDKGRTLFLRNILSTVSLEGWTMTPQIYEADVALLSKAVRNNITSSATGGRYVEMRYGDETSYVEWIVDVPSAGYYAISLRYAHDDSARPLRVFVNTQEVYGSSANNNPVLPLRNVGNPPTVPLQRCDGDCDLDDDCVYGTFCMQHNNMEAVPGCTGTKTSSWDYCVDMKDFDYGFNLLPTGGWNDDWHYSEALTVSLNAGQNTIRVQMPPKYSVGPNIDYLRVEGSATPITSSFRNPPHFMSLIPDVTSPTSIGEMNLRDAQYETDAVLDHYFYQDNVAPFLCVRIMQRFSFSNPSPRFVASCVDAFRTGTYTSGGQTFGSGDYGSLEALAASILLDREATEGAVATDPSHGSIREPILKVINLMRSMEYQTSIPTTLAGPDMQTTYAAKLWKIDEAIGQGPYEFPTVFSFFLPEYVPDSGPNLVAKLSSPESMIVTMPNVVNLLNGMYSLIKYGLGDCNSGFSRYPGYSDCSDNGLYERSFGHLFYEPTGVDDYERAADLALLLTAGRLSDANLNTIVNACSTEPDQPSKTRCMQQLIVSTGEFHSTNSVTQSGEARAAETAVADSTEPYKAIVYFYLSGGLDSYNMLAPHTCTRGVDVYERYRTIRGKSELSQGVGLPKDRLLSINANNPAQPCESFGIHENLPKLKELYDQGKLNFIANAGLLAKPVNVDNYNGETPVQLFAHNAMTLEATREDLYDEYAGTGVGGRIGDVLTQLGISTNLFSIDGQQVLLTGEAGQGPSQFIISSSGLATFNNAPSINNMNDVIKTLNNDTTADSGFYAETWSSKLYASLDNQQVLKQEVDATTVTTIFPAGSTSDEFEMVTRLMQTREARKSKRDIFFVEDGGYDTHSNVDANLITNFGRINGVIEAFVDELQVLGLWENTVVIQFSEFARTLDPNTGDGTDHAWGGQHFMFGGLVNGGHVLGQYPDDFEQGDAAGIALSRGRMIPTTPWDAMWKGVAEWFGIPANSAEMDKVLPLNGNFNNLYSEADLFVPAPAPAQGQTPEAASNNLFD